MMRYGDYIAEIEYDDETENFHGSVINVRGAITFVSNSVAGLKKEFKESVRQYIEMCKEIGIDPEKPYSGEFRLRIEPELHAKLVLAAAEAGKSLNSYIADALSQAVSRKKQTVSRKKAV